MEGIKEATAGRVGQANIAIQAIGPKTATIIILFHLTNNNIIRQGLTFHPILNLMGLTHSQCPNLYLHQETYICNHLTLQCLTIINILSPNLLILVLSLVIIHLLVFTILNILTIIHSYLIMDHLVAMAMGIQKVRQIPVVPRKVNSN